jgi:predicted ATPase
LSLPGYQIVGELVRSEPHVLHRARREADGAPVLLKVPSRHPPRPSQLDGLRHEFALRKDLELPGVPRAYELVPGDGTLWLVLEDTGALPVRSLRGSVPMELAQFFHVALQITAILAELHRNDVIHGNLQPGSLFVHTVTHGVWLEDFTRATRGTGETKAPSLLPGILAYSSPEQTGRMNRAIDHRTDLYSLGVTFYELLTGERPFRSPDALELIHAHIAQSPVPPEELRPDVPEAVSRIVLKLLEKTAEARYQGAPGLRADLEVCAREWNARRAITTFDLGAYDASDRFLIPQHLYGRDREVEELSRAFTRACEGASGLTLVSGYSGVGKTSLIQELYRPIVKQGGYFISGKFDQVVRNIPYGALIQAFRGLVQQLLTESEERLGLWRSRLQGALQGNGAVLTEVIPEIELIIGEQPAAPPLAPAETQNRFRLVLQNFVGALAGPQHPLVVFLDDLQWADAGSLALLQPLLNSPELRHLCLIGSFRDNEVDASHLLTRTISALEAAGAQVDRIVLAPLRLPDLERLVSDCLGRRDAETQALARLVAAKTEGNPFFVIQFLKTLRQEGLLQFDVEQGGWIFHLEDIARAPMTGNVIDLMSRKIERLSEETQRVLTLAACVGNPFDLHTLAVVSELSPDAAARSLRGALEEGLLLRTDSEGAGRSGDPSDASPTYAFLHDRVQQAAYAGLPEEKRQGLHLAVGRLLRERADLAQTEASVFDVVSHLNLGRSLITDDAERLSLARLNLMAGARAKSSTAYEAARGYFTAGLDLLPEARWSSDYALLFELEREAAECECLCGQFAEAERRFERLLGRAQTALDKAQVYDLRMIQYENLSRYAEAAAIGLEGLRLFGVSYSTDEEGKRAALEEEMRAIEVLRASRPIGSLVDLPVMAEPETRMVLRLLTDIWAPAYISGDVALVALVSARMVRLSIEHGNTEDSAYGYVTHAISVGPLRGEYEAAYEWGALALAVNERLADAKRRAKIHQQFGAHVALWRRPLITCVHHAQEACRTGLQTGDFTYAGYGAMSEAWPAFLISRDLDRFVHDYTPTLGLLQRIRTTGLADIHNVMLSRARALQGRTEGPLSLSHEGFQEEAFIRAHADNPFYMTIFQIAKLHLAVVFEDWDGALAAAREARRLSWGQGTIWPVLLDFWGGLALASLLPEGAAGAERPHWRDLLGARDALQVLADNCPENFHCFSLLLRAEMARIEGAPLEVIELFEEAIRYARRTESLQHQALAQELYGRWWLGRGQETVAAAYLGEARRCYRLWGAVAKVRQLEARYPRLLWAAEEDEGPSLDLASVTKAAHALSVEIVLEELLRKLLRIALENAGAQRGLFLQEKDGRLVIEAEGSVDNATVRLPGSLPLESSEGASRAIVQYVRKTGDSLVIGDAATDERFATDPYVLKAQPKSILCVPVVHQGQLRGILYLENNLTTDAFTKDRIRVLDLLSSQAAISLENARLYREKSEEVERRTRAEAELRAALAEVSSLTSRLEAENVYLQEEIRREHNFEEMVGNSKALVQVLDTVERVASTDTTVLISGETGTGKELVARALHNRSTRKGRPLVKVNCGAIAAGLVESELFGHVKGAFTGALERRVGRFELAQGGTIFLDEIGEVPLDTQVKLLRILQEHEFEPVGSSRTVRVDVRVIAATNRDLAEAVRTGQFRSDLYYRLNVLPLKVPPLRERREDIPELLAFFLSHFCRRLGKAMNGVSRETMDRLVEYPWPGNVRELQNVIERAVVLGQGALLVLDEGLLPAAPRHRGPLREQARGSAVVPPQASPSAALALEEVERRHILEVLQSTQGVIEGPSGAARVLDLHPNTLRSRMKKMGIRRPSHEIS